MDLSETDRIADELVILEVSPRDGLQNEKKEISTADKVELIVRAAKAGARRIEAVSFVSPKAVPQMADAAEVMANLLGDHDLKADGVMLSGLALNRRGFERAMQAGVDEINYVVVASDTFSQRNQGATTAQTMEQIAELAPAAHAAGMPFTVSIAAAFGCPFEGEVDPAKVADIAAALGALGVKEICLADTIGVGDPVSVERRLAAVQAAAPDAALRCHFHNTRNTGLANAYAAWRFGVRVLDASIGGIGGCPFAPAATGNIPTEDVAYMFQRMGVETGLDLQALIETAAWLGPKLDGQLPAMLGRAGVFPKVSA